MNNDLNLAVLRRQLNQRNLVDSSIHNLAKSIFKPGVKVQWRMGARDYYGAVVEVVGVPGKTQVRVKNVMTTKNLDLQLSDITGLVQEN